MTGIDNLISFGVWKKYGGGWACYAGKFKHGYTLLKMYKKIHKQYLINFLFYRVAGVILHSRYNLLTLQTALLNVEKFFLNFLFPFFKIGTIIQ